MASTKEDTAGTSEPISEDTSVDGGVPATGERITYTREELLELRDCELSKIWPSCLERTYCLKEDDSWSAVRWFQENDSEKPSRSQADGTSEESDSTAKSDGVVLGPQRGSFGLGCSWSGGSSNQGGHSLDLNSSSGRNGSQFGQSSNGQFRRGNNEFGVRRQPGRPSGTPHSGHSGEGQQSRDEGHRWDRSSASHGRGQGRSDRGHGDLRDRHGDSRDRSHGDPRDRDPRDRHGDQRDRHGDQRDRHGDQRDRHGDQRDRHGDQRDRHGDQRDRHGDQRDRHGDPRDRSHGDPRDRSHGDPRDRHGDPRDRDPRDRHGDQRDRHGDPRDRSHGDPRDRHGDPRDRNHGHQSADSHSRSMSSPHGNAYNRHSDRDRDRDRDRHRDKDRDRDRTNNDKSNRGGQRRQDARTPPLRRHPGYGVPNRNEERQEKTPEWMEYGPSSRLEMMELRGFGDDDPRLSRGDAKSPNQTSADSKSSTHKTPGGKSSSNQLKPEQKLSSQKSSDPKSEKKSESKGTGDQTPEIRSSIPKGSAKQESSEADKASHPTSSKRDRTEDGVSDVQPAGKAPSKKEAKANDLADSETIYKRAKKEEERQRMVEGGAAQAFDFDQFMAELSLEDIVVTEDSQLSTRPALPTPSTSQEGSRFQRFFTHTSPSNSPQRPKRHGPRLDDGVVASLSVPDTHQAVASSSQPELHQVAPNPSRPDPSQGTDESVIRMLHKLAGSGGSMLVSNRSNTSATDTSVRQPVPSANQMRLSHSIPVEFSGPYPSSAMQPFTVDPPRPFLSSNETYRPSSQTAPGDARHSVVRQPLAAQFGAPRPGASISLARRTVPAGSGADSESTAFNRLKQMVGEAALPPMPTPSKLPEELLTQRAVTPPGVPGPSYIASSARNDRSVTIARSQATGSSRPQVGAPINVREGPPSRPFDGSRHPSLDTSTSVMLQGPGSSKAAPTSSKLRTEVPLAFTPTAVMRKMTTTKKPEEKMSVGKAARPECRRSPSPSVMDQGSPAHRYGHQEEGTHMRQMIMSSAASPLPQNATITQFAPASPDGDRQSPMMGTRHQAKQYMHQVSDNKRGGLPSNEALLRAQLLAQANAYQTMALHASRQFPAVNPLAAAAAANAVRMQQAVLTHGPAAMMAVARHGSLPGQQHYSQNDSVGSIGPGGKSSGPGDLLRWFNQDMFQQPLPQMPTGSSVSLSELEGVRLGQ